MNRKVWGHLGAQRVKVEEGGAPSDPLHPRHIPPPTCSCASGSAIAAVSLMASVLFSTGTRHDASATSAAGSSPPKVPLSSSSAASSSSAVSISQAARPLSVTTPAGGGDRATEAGGV